MSTLKKRTNLNILESELEDSIKADELYKLQNDAKLRAIEQRVPSYEHFRNMVQVAHLKPLKRSELQNRPENCWNHCYNKKDESSVRIEKISLQLRKNILEDILIPQNSTEFLNIWKSIEVDKQKLEFLLKFRDKLKNKYFKMEVPAEFIEDFIRLSLANCFGERVAQIIEILEILSECNRFTLSLSMISKSNNNHLFILFKEILGKNNTVDEINKIENLMRKYSIPIQK